MTKKDNGCNGCYTQHPIYHKKGCDDCVGEDYINMCEECTEYCNYTTEEDAKRWYVDRQMADLKEILESAPPQIFSLLDTLIESIIDKYKTGVDAS